MLTDRESTRTTYLRSISSLNSSLNKGLGFLEQDIESQDIESQDISGLDWNLLREDLSLPSAVLYEERLQHNLDWMQEFITAYGVKLAPHGKTTMAPKLFTRQLQAGAWGITLATAHQTQVAYAHGVRRVLMANQLVGKENMATIGRLLADSDFEYYCLVDSAALVDQLGAYFLKHGHRLNVLLELGVAGGRTGVRNEAQLQAVLASLTQWQDSIALRGVEIYEGVLEDEASIRSYLQHAVDVTQKLAAKGFFKPGMILLSGAGSAWYDVVAEVFSAADFDGRVEIVLRPGCYLTHDIGAYREAQTKIQERNPIARRIGSGLLPALQVWAYVQSVPEAERAIIAMGKRDAAFDAGLPAPALHFRPGETAPKAALAHWTLTKMMDQHAYLRIAEGDDLRVGDMIAFDISHPCLTFDKWRTLPVLNAEYQVIDIVLTYF
ncbi:amino acid deaminase [Acidicapsa ligni]|uniref:amino acid deaminase n=1 Tax=Acidicapsa ligni TaxID=542300 RepID=UPI0021E0D732|nr:amino acid deaminase [Acidicapsa ligni]